MELDPIDDLDETLRQTLEQLYAEALVTPTVLTLPPEVLRAIVSYQKTHGIPLDQLLTVALQAQKGQIQAIGQSADQLIKDSGLIRLCGRMVLTFLCAVVVIVIVIPVFIALIKAILDWELSSVIPSLCL